MIVSRTQRIAATAAAVLVLVLAQLGLLDAPAQSYTDAALKRALVTFAVARTLNGVISVAQGTEVALAPAGVGVTLTPGELLDPVNDLVERFSWVMLASSTSLGIQSMLLHMSGWWAVTALLAAGLGVWLLSLWAPARLASLRPWAYRVSLVLLFLRFAVPLLLVATGWVSDTFLAPEQLRGTAALRESSAQIESLAETVPAPDGEPASPSLMDRLSSFVDEHLPSMDVHKRIEALQTRASAAIEQIIDLIVAFVLETILVPLAFLWLLARFFRQLVAGSA